MKITSLISASAIALALAAPVYAQTAPTTPAPTTPAPTTPTTPAPTPAPTGIPAAYVNVAAVQQVNAQLTAQGYTITDVVQNANGSYSVLSTSAAGQLRLITVNPATGGVTDTVTAGVPAGTAGIAPGGQFDNDGDDGNDRDGGDDDKGGNDDNGRGDSNDNGDSGSDDGGEDDSNDSDD